MRMICQLFYEKEQKIADFLSCVDGKETGMGGDRMKKCFAMIIIGIVMTLGTAASVHADIPADSSVYNGHSYKVYNTSATWKEAESYCESLGGYLAVITSSQENAFVNSIVKKSGTKKHYWLGGSDEVSEGTWTWVTGEAFSYKNWQSGQPNDKTDHDPNGHDYLEMVNLGNRNSGKWTYISNDGYSPYSPGSPDYYSKDYFGFVCEWNEAYTGEGLQPNTVPENEMNSIIITTPKEEIPGASYPLLQARAINVKTKSFTLKWNKLTGAEKYLIYGNTCNKNGKGTNISSLRKQQGQATSRRD